MADKPPHRYELRQRRTPAATDSSVHLDRELSPLPAARMHGASPRPENAAFSSDNMFRAARGSGMENMLLFREQPRQLAVLALVVAAVSYFSFTHDSQVQTCVYIRVYVCIESDLLHTDGACGRCVLPHSLFRT